MTPEDQRMVRQAFRDAIRLLRNEDGDAERIPFTGRASAALAICEHAVKKLGKSREPSSRDDCGHAPASDDAPDGGQRG